jgi:CxxC motif-containing protein (DUF1111 family)
MCTHHDLPTGAAALLCSPSSCGSPHARHRRRSHSLDLLVSTLSIVALAACTDSPTVPDSARGPSASRRSESESGNDRRNHSPLSGGATTIFDATAGAFGQPAPNLSAAEVVRHDQGDAIFSTIFSADPSSPNPGLGPMFENVSCESCHAGDGRGRPPLPGEAFATLLFRASVPGLGPHGGPKPVPGFGTQIELRAAPGYDPMVGAALQYSDSNGTFADGSAFQLQVPHYSFSGAYTVMPYDMLVSPRVAPVNFGVGLLEAVPEEEIRSLQYDRNGKDDGVRGHPNIVWNAITGQYAIGRFGWKANVPTLLQQVAGAFNGDMGVTSSFFPAEPCEGAFPGCARHQADVTDDMVALVTFYTQTLGVPARRNLDDPQVLRGEAFFARAGCASCHTPTLTTGQAPGIPAISAQMIHPYTDLLLHNMGPALADNRPDFRAAGNEWRTPPLWGVGLVSVVNGFSSFLHDGRARSLLEAVLWHGGEATKARERVRNASKDQRAALVAFLESL